MALKNYVDTEYLQTLVWEVLKYKWSDQTDIDNYKTGAEEKVVNDLIKRGLNISELRPFFYLREDTDTETADVTGVAYNDISYKRLRLVYNVTTRTGTTALVLQGSTDNTTWYTVKTKSVTATGEGTFRFTEGYKYYRINATITAGTLAYTAWLVEGFYDLLFAYWQLYLVFLNAGKAVDSKYTEYANVFKALYDDELATMPILTGATGEVVNSQVRLSRGAY